jgi:hypothetical protein
MAVPKLQIRRSAVQGATPTTAQLSLGELAINTYDGKLFLKKNVDGTETIVDISGGIPNITIDTSLADILNYDNGAFSADDAGSDKLVFWDDSADKLTHLTIGSGLTITDTTISATGVASTATITTSSTNSAFKIPFANTTISTTGNYELLQETTATFTYNPSTNTLIAGTFSGTATVASTATITTSSTSSAFKIPFANTTSSSTGSYGLLQDNTATFTYNPSTNTLNVGVITVETGISLPDSNYIYFGSSDDVKIFYDGVANDLEIELESTANKIAITDNGNYKHQITRVGVGVNVGENALREELDVIGDIGVQAFGATNRFVIQHNNSLNSLDFVFV